ncbi:hypothetical protein EJ110_NYTH59028 [Nymphaea thermarum]|nr:hypothetical protein EJ110_NYTH59028 [Nymphaea thermarum]
MKSLIEGLRQSRKRTEAVSSVSSFHSLSDATECFIRANQDPSREISMHRRNVEERSALWDCDGLPGTQVMAAHGLMLRKLGQFRLSKSKRIQTLLRRRKLIHSVFFTVFVGAVVCSSIAAAVHAPPLLAALPAAVVTAATFVPLTSWVENFWKEEECDIKARLQTANVLNVSSSVLIRELQAIGFSVRALTDHKTKLACHRGFISRNKGNGILLTA